MITKLIFALFASITTVSFALDILGLHDYSIESKVNTILFLIIVGFCALLKRD
jgi:hypothetical protein